MAEYFATEKARENALESMRIHGGYGYSREFNDDRLYRDAPLLLIGEGTNEMQQGRTMEAPHPTRGTIRARLLRADGVA